ncbi:unnamed protein product [Didymodactylos carnosus]|nr:unnamed protein product [Didymodactylos carnosus]CAF4595414.1 unnamed protein product [Didymodactylos carnosus]
MEPPPPLYSAVVERASIEHLPPEYADIEKFIAEMVGATGGRIRKIRPLDQRGTYRFEITGTYRYCENIHRQHKKNQIYFIIDPIKRIYYQKCYDPDCQGFRSRSRTIIDGHTNAIPEPPKNPVDRCPNCQKQLTNNRREKCERCGNAFCSKCVSDCELCCDATHCNRCIEACWDCHDPS